MKTFCRFLTPSEVKAVARIKTNKERHVSTNLSQASTVEVRIFSGLFDLDTFMKNIEFCISLFEFTRENSLRDINIRQYKKYVKGKQKTFKYLYKFLLSKGEIK
jgi:hypothetical protein